MALTALFTFCGSKAQAQDETIVFTPQWTAQAQFAGYYVAEAKGFYREAGVKVKIEHPSATQPAMSRLRKNECQATTLQLCQNHRRRHTPGEHPSDIDEQCDGDCFCPRS